jgi:hypothetical protein
VSLRFGGCLAERQLLSEGELRGSLVALPGLVSLGSPRENLHIFLGIVLAF